MDIATIMGIAGGFAVLFGAILLEGSSPFQFLNLLATIVTIGGSCTAVLIRYPMHSFIAALGVGVKEAFFYKQTNTHELIDTITELSHILRKSGPMGLESVKVENRFLARGLQMLVDGYDMPTIKRSLERERDLQYDRLEEGHRIFRSLGEAAPGMGMVGTLIGLVSMFTHMDDPKKIGPGMAIALLNTLYGAVIANLIALPISDKLFNRAEEDATNNSLVIDAILMMRENKSPMQIADELQAYLPLHKRDQDAQAA